MTRDALVSWVIGATVAVFASALAGWGWNAVSSGEGPGLERAAKGKAHVLAVRHGGLAAAEARERFAQLNFARPPDPPALETPPPPPPPPDVAVLFRRDLSAIEETPQGPVLWVVDTLSGPGRRKLAVGEAYRDGWKVAAITPQEIQLRRRREQRDIAVFAASAEGAN